MSAADLLARPSRPTTAPLTARDVARLLDRPEPTDEQVEIIEAPLEPLLVVAGAGSGKTETMAARVVWLVANGHVHADEVLGLTFTRKAAGELAERIAVRLRRLRRELRVEGDGLTPDRPRIATYNAYAGSLVRDHGLRVGLDPDARLLTEAGRWQLAHRVVETWPGELAVDKSPQTVTEAVLQLAGALAEHLLTPAEAAAELRALAADVEERPPAEGRRSGRSAVAAVATALRARADVLGLVEALAARKRELGVVDFADQVALACRIAAEVEGVGEVERSQYRVVLLDEYQDTSVAQVDLLAHLFGDGHPVTAVGDPHQAIYGWRGASAGAVERFPERFPRVRDGLVTPSPVRTLATSWRNDTAVLAAANEVAAPLRALARVRAAKRGEAGVPLPVLGARPGAGPGGVHLLVSQTAEEEVAEVAAAIAERWAPSRPGQEPRTAAVLCRSRSQMPLVADALRAAGLPVEVVGLGGLLSTPEVVDLRSALVVAHDPSRADAAMRLLTGLRLGIADLAVLHDHARRLARPASPADGATPVRETDAEPASIVEAVERPPAPGWCGRAGRPMSAVGLARVHELGAVLHAIRAQAHLPLPELVVEAERLLGLDVEVLARPGEDPARARRHLDAFAEVAADFADGSQAPTLGAFLAWLDAADAYEHGLDTVDVDPDPAAVQVLTVHAAKGLEWDVVAVPGLAEGSFPHYDGTPRPTGAPSASGWLTDLRELPYPMRGDAADLPHLDLDAPADEAEMAAELDALKARTGAHLLAEERRLAYVALTRARSELVVSASWWKEGSSRPRPPSRFVAELVHGQALTSVRGEPGAAAPEAEANPLAVRRADAVWPAPRPDAVVEAATRAAAAVRAAASGTAGGEPAAAPAELSSRGAAWWWDAELLLAERARRGRRGVAVELPRHLSASSVVALVGDPAAFAVDRRRPVPQRPSVAARRGTQFHAWVERHYGAASLIGVDELPGADDAELPTDEELLRLQRTFLASRWAGLAPVAVEADLETPVAGTIVRCRVDAVFATPQGVEIVDWKTGSPPADAADDAARQMQLAVYRLAWARLHGLSLDAVRAAFFYVAHDRVVEARPMPEAAIVAAVTASVGGRWSG